MTVTDLLASIVNSRLAMPPKRHAMIGNILEFCGPLGIKLLAGAACLLVFAPLLAAFVGPLVG